ncbi:developmental pluripotency-associated protein 5A [Mus musculus]|uniref:Developmental pluripotency-associated protein 5A n=1 Tax=Mus musculus TaxID=10090 RepID=DPA5A_MOUSE|nr:developmental pluripotency-associated protein 5A [Mus musculus]Q9CQS7.2 RecName: Full=Developmental pluripotency-associated protein 5A; Short=mDppa5; AltName: Full=ES cell-associated transcript 2 protein; AltName: Full=Embryonal stem cell-specific gene 1 protein; Short=ESG-1; AltName: Full=Protein pH 34 [Mus musculus]AAH92353.1 Developmental pluripotency associated 5A [Mus musculus]AAH92354.1 Developmental pluripotency associated 5A [Mus musculus]AAH95979.1 Developmental pluripotency associa|eukprot:NP_079550.2 developmental pluripotency-associated protein 5A [Mus musculus]
MMVTLVTRKDIPPWVKVPEDLKDPEVFQVQSLVLKYLFGPQGSRMSHIEQVSQAMFELKNLESPEELIEVFIYGSQNNKIRAKWMLQSMAERYHLRQQKGVLKLEESMKTLELGQCIE